MSKNDMQEAFALIKAAVREDRLLRDVTSRAIIPSCTRAAAVIIAQEPCVCAGLACIRTILVCAGFRTVRLRLLARDGQQVRASAKLARLEGPARALLAAERLILNLVSRLSGIATLTRAYTRALAGTGCALFDTRKTIPGLRALEKYAVRCGGGSNHRMHLADGVLVKDNHLALARPGALARAVRAWRRQSLRIEIEVDRPAQLGPVLRCEPDVVMLDNFSPAATRRALDYIGSFCAGSGLRRPAVEISGGVSLPTIRRAALRGVDRVSVGALTHAARGICLSCEITG